jgi:MFS family permease
MNGYTLTLAAFLPIGGSLGDRFGRSIRIPSLGYYLGTMRQF